MPGNIGFHLSVISIPNICDRTSIQDSRVRFHSDRTNFSFFNKGIGNDLQCEYCIRVLLFQFRSLAPGICLRAFSSLIRKNSLFVIFTALLLAWFI